MCYNIFILTKFDKFLSLFMLYFYKGDDYMYVLFVLLIVFEILILRNQPTSPTLQQSEMFYLKLQMN